MRLGHHYKRTPVTPDQVEEVFFVFSNFCNVLLFVLLCKETEDQFSVGKITKGIPKNSLFVYYFHVLGGGQMGARCIGDFVHLVANEDCEDI